MTRYPQIAPEDMYYEQIRVVQAVTTRRKPSVSSEGEVEGPFVPLVYVPGILDRLQSLGEHCRFHTAIPPKLRELAIMITARHVSAQIEFYVHAMEARECGFAEEGITEIAANRRPSKLDDDEALIYDFCTELHKRGCISDDVYARAEKRFGMAVILELIATCGYYGALGWVLNVTQTPVPAFLGEVVLPFSVPAD